MSQAAITVGSKVRVTRVRDRIPADLVSALQSDATGTVKDFKVTDALAIGDLEVLDGAGGIALEGGNQVGGDAIAHPGHTHLRADGDGSLGHVRRDEKVAPG